MTTEKKPDKVQIVRIIVASPGDVAKERKMVTDAVNEVNKTIARPAGLHLDVWKWETDGTPGFHIDGPQGRVDELMGLADADIVIAIFWRRFGTPVADAGSGTEHELRKAQDAWTQTGKPEIWVYFCTEKYFPTKAESEDRLKIIALQESLDEALWWEYRRTKFTPLIRTHLASYINRRTRRAHTD